MLPMAGSIAYLILEVLPELMSSRAGRATGQKVKSIVEPNRDINEAAKEFSASDSVENSMRLAEACLDKDLFNDAKVLYEKCLTGLHADDPYLMFGLARSEFGLGNYQEVRSILDRLIESNPDYKNQDAHLLYARTLEQLNEVAAALHEFETLHGYFTGPDASFYFAMFLKEQGQIEKAKAMFTDIARTAKNSNSHYNNLHSEIIKRARREAGS
jgi:hypothetical protein